MARVKWVEGKTFLGTDDSGRSVVMSSGDGPGVSPMQMLLLGLGGCSLVDIVEILRKQRQQVDSVDVEIQGERAEGSSRPWKTIHLHYSIVGTRLDPPKVERAIQLGLEKYCSVYTTLSGVATITQDFELHNKNE